MSSTDQVDTNDTVSKTDDEKVNDTDLEKGTKTDDQKLDTEEREQGSPEPVYTPPESSASWCTMDELNVTTDKQPAKGQTDNEKALTSEKDTEGETMADNEGKPTDETTNEAKDETEPKSAPESTGAPDASENTETKTEEEAKPTDAHDHEPKSENKDAQEQEPAEQTTEPSEPKEDKEEPIEQDKQTTDEKEPEETKASNKEKEAEVEKAKEETLIAKEKLDKQIKENERLQDDLKSALSNQETENEAYKKLTEENARLQKHYDDIKEKHDEMEGGQMLLIAELETLRKVNSEQKDDIRKLETEVKFLKETQGGDEAVKDLQEKLIRLSNEQEEKDRKIHSLEGELDSTKEKLKDAETNAARGGNADAPKSKTCIVM